MNRMKATRGAFLLAALLLAGCATPPAPPPTPVEAPAEKSAAAKEGDEVVALLAYYQRLVGMPADDLKREYQAANQAYARSRDELARLRLALLMSVPGAPWRDEARLLALLEGVGSRLPAGESPRRHLATLLARLAADQARETKRLEALVKEEQRRADELQQKLDAMLKIEENLRRGRR